MQHKTRLFSRVAMMLLMMLLTATTAWAEGVDYIDENGVAKNTATDDIVGNDNPTVLTSGGATSLSGWYYVSGTVNITGMVTLSGDVHIILCDKATLNIGTATERISSNCIYGDDKTLTIYGQSGQTGTLKAYNSASGSSAVYARNYTQHGGNVIIDGTNMKPLCLSGGNLTLSRGTLSVTAAATYSAIYLDTGKSVNISGGTLTATSELTHAIESAVNMSGGTLTANAPGSYYNYAIFRDVTFTGGKLTVNGGGIYGNVSLSWSSLNDSFTCNSFHTTVTIADGKTFYDETGASYTSSTTDLNTAIEGKTLRPYSPADFSVSGDEYTIHNATGWDVFCEALQDNTTYNRFSGKTVKLGGNIGSAESPVTRMAGTSQHDFCGTFDGKGYTLTVNLSSDSDSDHDYTAPFSYVANAKANPGDTSDSPAAIRNLNVAGTINATKDYASGIVGAFWGTLTIENCTSSVAITTNNKHAAGFISNARGNVTITNCLSSVTITGSISGDGTHAGFIGGSASGVETSITGCAFTGSLLTTNGTTHCAGFMGYNSGTLNITNSLFAPASISVGASESATFARYGNNCVNNINNCYYTEALGEAQGKKACPATAAPVGEATHAKYSVSGITPYTNGLKRTVDNVETFYYGGGDNVSVSYVNESGTTVSHAATALSPANMPTTLDANYDSNDDGTPDQGWYYVADDIDYTGKITLSGDVNIILAHGCTLNIGTEQQRISSSNCISGGDYTLTIYGQADGDGILNAYSSSSSSFAVSVKNYAQHGGIVTFDASNFHALNLYFGNLTLTRGTLTVNATGTDRIAIDLDIYYGVTVSGGTLNATGNTAINGSASTVPVLTMTGGTVNASGKTAIIGRVTYSGGNLTANGTTYGIYSNVTLSWTSADDRIYASSYGSNVTIDGKAFYNGSEVFSSGIVSDKTKLNGKTLTPAIAFADNSDNTSAIATNNSSTLAIQLSGRTLYWDGDWNTLCLPFGLSAEQIAASPLSGATIMELDGAGSHLTDGTLTLNFNAATEIEAGRPYIVKWPITRVITKPSDWHDFAADVAGGNTYEGKLVRLAADIEVSEMVGTSEHKFRGVFDGQGHTLTLNSLSASGEAVCAPFRYVEGATIANLHTTGTVIADNNNDSKFRSGLVGQSDGTTTIHNCWSSVTISSSISGDGTHGGFIGVSDSGNATISNCRFDGSFSGSNTKCWGGFVGWSSSTTTISNSVFAPEGISIDQTSSATFSRNNVTTTNCYYSQALNNATNGATAIGSRSADDLAADLGSGWQVKDGKAVPVTVAPGITNPVFSGVTVPSGYTSAEAIATALVEASSKSTYVDFIGTYSPIVWETENRNVLFLGDNNTLYFPQPDGDNNPHVNAFRGYFQLNGITASDITEARMNFDEQGTQTGIGHTEITERADAWYSLDGRKLDGKPTSKGLYIHGNKKVVVE